MTLELRNGKWFENGKLLLKKNYIYHANGKDGPMIISCITGQLYRLRNFTGVVIV